ncbi:hypothetical protein [Alkalitalea saponilacus]|uniref:Oligosaccharide repeat unit polymerase n=1 Tax=Alkalitalea saponilacus TaxID=889453 RepID=A0A1T5GZE6_9BACT|nr:hypothetical protein [Alkalitalea saponilacus]ASB50970.1 hypothetical protein CDL62_18365 [Alkalitalea saponilacus]SKC13755.1 hypothetical protein SAMN03080601_01991 [Alkalitalea saponilacus]
MIIRPFTGEFRHNIIQKAIIAITILGSIWTIFSPTYFEYLVAMILLLYLAYYFMQSVFTVGIFLALFYQWVQVSIKAIYGAFTGSSLESLTKYPEHISSAFFLSALSLLLLSMGIRQIIKKLEFSWDDLNFYINQYSVHKFFLLYLAFNFISGFLFTLRFTIPGLFQAIAILSYFKWSLFIILFILVHKKQKLLVPFWILVAIEFSTSFISFFASFRSIIIYLLIGYLSLRYISSRRLTLIGIYGFMIYLVAIIWTDIKMDYRQFLNQGQQTQAILVSKEEARNYLKDAILSYNFSGAKETREELINRMSYIDFFSATQDYIPSEKDHENGKVLKQSVMHILMPRMFFPDKPIVEDSKHLTKYTGIYFPSYAKGVSFSLGYTGDFYIDFGPVLMFPAILLFGLLIGIVLLSIHSTSPNVLWSFGALTAAFDILYKFENSQIKFLGNLIWFWIIFMILNKFIIPHIDHYLKE